MNNKPSRTAQSSHGGRTFTFPPTEFDADFSRIVGPKLLNLVIAYAYHIQTGISTWGEVTAALRSFAWRHGASNMSEDALDELWAWLGTELLSRVDNPPADGVLTPDQVEALLRWRV